MEQHPMPASSSSSGNGTSPSTSTASSGANVVARVREMVIPNIYEDQLLHEEQERNILEMEGTNKNKHVEMKVKDFFYNLVLNTTYFESKKFPEEKIKLNRMLTTFKSVYDDKQRFRLMLSILHQEDLAKISEYFTEENLPKINKRFGPFTYRKPDTLEFKEYTPEPNHYPITLAAEVGSLPIIEYLVSLNAEVAVQATPDLTPVHIASRNGYMHILDYFVRNGVPSSYTAVEGNRVTPLMHATAGKHLECLKYLLDKGADIDKVDIFQRTALFYAIKTGDNEIVSFLLNHGASIDKRDNQGRSPLHYLYSKQVQISTENRFNILKILVNINRGIIHVLQHNGTSVLSKVAKIGTVNEIAFLLQHGADINAGKKDNWKTSLWNAVLSPKRDTKMVGFLIEKGADVKGKNKEGLTVLEYAMLQETREGVIRALANQSQPSTSRKNFAGAIALHVTINDERPSSKCKYVVTKIKPTGEKSGQQKLEENVNNKEIRKSAENIPINDTLQNVNAHVQNISNNENRDDAPRPPPTPSPPVLLFGGNQNNPEKNNAEGNQERDRQNVVRQQADAQVVPAVDPAPNNPSENALVLSLHNVLSSYLQHASISHHPHAIRQPHLCPASGGNHPAGIGNNLAAEVYNPVAEVNSPAARGNLPIYPIPLLPISFRPVAAHDFYHPYQPTHLPSPHASFPMWGQGGAFNYRHPSHIRHFFNPFEHGSPELVEDEDEVDEDGNQEDQYQEQDVEEN